MNLSLSEIQSFFNPQIQTMVHNKELELWPDIVKQHSGSDIETLYSFLEEITYTPYRDDRRCLNLLKDTFHLINKDSQDILSERCEKIKESVKNILIELGEAKQFCYPVKKRKIIQQPSAISSIDTTPTLHQAANTGNTEIASFKIFFHYSPSEIEDFYAKVAKRSVNSNDRYNSSDTFSAISEPKHIYDDYFIDFNQPRSLGHNTHQENSTIISNRENLQRPPEIITNGVGIKNGGNTCYIASVLQAIAHVPELINIIRAKQITNNKLVDESNKLLNTLSSQTGLSISTAAINEYRRLCLDAGFFYNLADISIEKSLHSTASNHLQILITSQNDAAEFLQFILAELEIPQVEYRVHVDYELDIPITYLQRQQSKDFLIPIAINSSHTSMTIQELLNKRCVVEKIDSEQILLQKDTDLTEKQKSYVIEATHRNETIKTIQTFTLNKQSIPEYLVVAVKRHASDFQKAHEEKPHIPIIPSESITLSCHQEQAHTVEYTLKAVVVHNGYSYNSGHYYTYVPNDEHEKGSGWIEYNDEKVLYHSNPEKEKNAQLDTTSAYDDICLNGYLYFFSKKK